MATATKNRTTHRRRSTAPKRPTTTTTTTTYVRDPQGNVTQQTQKRDTAPAEPKGIVDRGNQAKGIAVKTKEGVWTIVPNKVLAAQLFVAWGITVVMALIKGEIPSPRKMLFVGLVYAILGLGADLLPQPLAKVLVGIGFLVILGVLLQPAAANVFPYLASIGQKLPTARKGLQLE